MQSTRLTLAAAFVLGLTAAAGAQEPANRIAPAPAATQPTAVDVNRLPLDLSRIQRRLRSEAERQSRDGLNLRYFVDVYAPAPAIVLFTQQDDLQMGPVPNSAPSHREVLQHITPREHSAPAADFGALFRWLSDRARK